MDINEIRNKIKDGDIEGVKIFIKEHPEKINQTDTLGQTCLMAAGKRGDTEIINLLINAGADLDMTDRRGRTALHFAVDSHQHQAVSILISRGSDVNAKDKHGWTPLHLVVWMKKEWKDVVAALLQTKVDSVEVNQRDNSDRTPLHYACSCGYTDTVRLLLNHTGIEVNLVDKYGDTPLHLAVRNQCSDVVTLMLSQTVSLKLDMKNHIEMTPLLEAVSRGHLGITHRLIALGANINAVDGEGNNCLHLAMERDAFNSEGAPLDILDECCTELSLRKDERLSGIVVTRYLAKQGADFYHKNDKNNTPLDLVRNAKLKTKLQTILPPQCFWCGHRKATTKVHPCGHLVTCEECSNTPFKRCLRCLKPVTSRGQVESQKLDGKLLHGAAKKLGSQWQQVGVFLGIAAIDQDIIKNDFPRDTVKQSYQMLCEWFINCEPEERTVETLRKAFKEAECFAALECLSLNER